MEYLGAEVLAVVGLEGGLAVGGAHGPRLPLPAVRAVGDDLARLLGAEELTVVRLQMHLRLCACDHHIVRGNAPHEVHEDGSALRSRCVPVVTLTWTWWCMAVVVWELG